MAINFIFKIKMSKSKITPSVTNLNEINNPNAKDDSRARSPGQTKPQECRELLAHQNSDVEDQQEPVSLKKPKGVSIQKETAEHFK